MSTISNRRLRFLLLFLFTGLGNLQAQSVDELVTKGLQMDSLSRYFQAINLFTQALDIDPTKGVIYYNRGNSYMNAKNYNLALVDFNKAISLDTSITDAYFNRHLANRYTGNFQFAMADITDYLKRQPDDFEAIDARADLAVEMKEYDVAIKDLNSMIKVAGNQNPLKMRLAEIYVLNKQFDLAEEIYNQLLVANQDNYQVYLSRAFVRYYMGNYSASINDINLFSLHQPGYPDALKLKADDYFYLKKFEDAAALYKNLLITDSLNANLLADYGHCLLQSNKFTEAERILTRSILAKAENPAYAYLGRGIARFNLGKGDEACTDWVKSKMLGEKRAGEYLEKNCKTKEIPQFPR